VQPLTVLIVEEEGTKGTSAPCVEAVIYSHTAHATFRKNAAADR